MTTIEVLTNAWNGVGPGTSAFADDWDDWGARPLLPLPKPPDLGGPLEAVDDWDWQNVDVGWALLAPDVADPQKRAATDDLPPALQQLVKDRGGRVLRYLPHLRVLDPVKGIELDVAAPIGSRPGEIPRFVLVWGGPTRIPWAMQFLLNSRVCAGRLDLEGTDLESYVTALRSDWHGGVAAGPTLVWSVRDDAMGQLMEELVARPVAERYAATPGWKQQLQDLTKDGTRAGLEKALGNKPAVVVTTSHGCTGPAGPDLQGTLGLPVASGGELVRTDHLGGWEPNGAIWYAHACCSAGCAASSGFDGLFGAGTQAAAAIAVTQALGDRVAPLPRALLGAKKPLRAFVGHVEITLDWVLHGLAPNNQPLTKPIVDALHRELGLGRPVGWAFTKHFAPIAASATIRELIDQDPDAFANPKLERLYHRAVAIDRMSTVILGDPTAALPVGP